MSSRARTESKSGSMSSAATMDSGVSNNTTATNYPGVRRRISKACNYCRQRKIRCQGTTPCLNYKNHNIDCVYSKTIRKKKKQTISKKPTLQDLERRMNKMDTRIEKILEHMMRVITVLKDNNLTNKKLPLELEHDDQISSAKLRKSLSVSDGKSFLDEDDDEDEEDEEGLESDEEFDMIDGESELEFDSNSLSPISDNGSLISDRQNYHNALTPTDEFQLFGNNNNNGNQISLQNNSLDVSTAPSDIPNYTFDSYIQDQIGAVPLTSDVSQKLNNNPTDSLNANMLQEQMNVMDNKLTFTLGLSAEVGGMFNTSIN